MSKKLESTTSCQLSLFAEDSPAPTYPAQAKARALLEAALGSGLSLPGLSPRFVPPGLWSKMSRPERSGGWIRSWPGWNSSTMRRYRSLCRRKMLELHTCVGEFLSLPTPTTAGNMLSPSMQKWPAHRRLLTPSANDYGSNRGGIAGRTGKVRESLETMVRNGRLPTPTARDYKGPTGEPSKGGRNLPRDLGQRTRCLSPRFVEWMMGLPPGWTETSG
jgi:hypothetical protein